MNKILKLLTPGPPIAGLEVSDSSLRCLFIKGGKPETYSVKLESGVVVDGKLQNKEAFLKSLLELRLQITKKAKKKLFAIINISAANVYSQIFDLPKVAESNLEEAAKLNLQMICPINVADAYSDCQKVGENKSENKIEIAGVFIYKNIIDDFSEIFTKANFIIVAIEFVPLAISRIVKNLALNFDNQSSYILFHASSDGLNFLIIRNGSLYFNYFTPWASIKREKRYLNLEEFRSVVIDEIKKILGFYNRNWTDPIKEFFIIVQGLADEVKEIISKNFSFEAQEISLKKFNQLEMIWFPALGSALRGQIDRSEDTIISLANTGTEEEFIRQIFLVFVYLWQKIIFSFLIFFVLAFSAASVFLLTRVIDAQENKNLIVFQNKSEINELKTQANEFNERIALLSKAKSETIRWSSFFSKIKGIADQDEIKILRISVGPDQKSIYINARAFTEKQATNFKDKLADDSQFKKVSMPLAGLTPTSDNLVDFYVNFNID